MQISPKETICIKCQILFSRKKSEYFKTLYAEMFTQHAKCSGLSIKYLLAFKHYFNLLGPDVQNLTKFLANIILKSWNMANTLMFLLQKCE